MSRSLLLRRPAWAREDRLEAVAVPGSAVPGSRGPALRIAVSRSGDTVTVALAGELDLATAAPLRTRLATALQDEPPATRLVVDLAALEFLDASGIAVLLTAQRALAARGGVVVLRSPNRLVRRVVKVLELESVLPVES